MVHFSRVSPVGRCDHTVKLINAICTADTYSHHYAYSAHVKAAACIPRSSGVVFVAAHHFPGVGCYDIYSRLDCSCPAVSPPGVDRLASLIGTLCGRMQKISKKSLAYSDQSSRRADRRITWVCQSIVASAGGRWHIRP